MKFTDLKNYIEKSIVRDDYTEKGRSSVML